MMLLVKYGVQITIVYDSKAEQCEAHCGLDWSSAEAMALASQRIRDKFGERIQLEYLDLSQSVVDYLASELHQRIRHKNLSLPLLMIDGEPRISGQFDIRQLLDAIDAEMEIKS